MSKNPTNPGTAERGMRASLRSASEWDLLPENVQALQRRLLVAMCVAGAGLALVWATSAAAAANGQTLLAWLLLLLGHVGTLAVCGASLLLYFQGLLGAAAFLASALVSDRARGRSVAGWTIVDAAACVSALLWFYALVALIR